MWLFTEYGFFSIVEKPEDGSDPSKKMLTVRARVRSDLDEFCRRCGMAPSEIVEVTHADYRYRVRAERNAIIGQLAEAVHNVDYDNFKSRVAEIQGQARAACYHKVWDVVQRLQVARLRHDAPPATET